MRKVCMVSLALMIAAVRLVHAEIQFEPVFSAGLSGDLNTVFLTATPSATIGYRHPQVSLDSSLSVGLSSDFDSLQWDGWQTSNVLELWPRLPSFSTTMLLSHQQQGLDVIAAEQYQDLLRLESSVTSSPMQTAIHEFRVGVQSNTVSDSTGLSVGESRADVEYGFSYRMTQNIRSGFSVNGLQTDADNQRYQGSLQTDYLNEHSNYSVKLGWVASAGSATDLNGLSGLINLTWQYPVVTVNVSYLGDITDSLSAIQLINSSIQLSQQSFVRLDQFGLRLQQMQLSKSLSATVGYQYNMTTREDSINDTTAKVKDLVENLNLQLDGQLGSSKTMQIVVNRTWQNQTSADQLSISYADAVSTHVSWSAQLNSRFQNTGNDVGWRVNLVLRP